MGIEVYISLLYGIRSAWVLATQDLRARSGRLRAGPIRLCRYSYLGINAHSCTVNSQSGKGTEKGFLARLAGDLWPSL